MVKVLSIRLFDEEDGGYLLDLVGKGEGPLCNSCFCSNVCSLSNGVLEEFLQNLRWREVDIAAVIDCPFYLEGREK